MVLGSHRKCSIFDHATKTSHILHSSVFVLLAPAPIVHHAPCLYTLYSISVHSIFRVPPVCNPPISNLSSTCASIRISRVKPISPNQVRSIEDSRRLVVDRRQVLLAVPRRVRHREHSIPNRARTQMMEDDVRRHRKHTRIIRDRMHRARATCTMLHRWCGCRVRSRAAQPGTTPASCGPNS
jgi:hypothetical protein